MKDDRVYLGHIRDAIQDILQYTAVGRDAFMTDRMQQDAVARTLEIFIPVRHPAQDWTEVVCDQWEYPNGRP
ncbi:MAG TPA: hypothetical protein VIK60_08755 [Vicinamibacterales bacterium]